MEDSLRNITNKDTTGTSRIPDIVSGSNCTDHRGQFIPNGLLYTPRGSDPCSVCTCASGDPILCRTVLCAPPTHCDSIKVKHVIDIFLYNMYNHIFKSIRMIKLDTKFLSFRYPTNAASGFV